MSSVPCRFNKMNYHLKYVSEFARQYFKFFNWKTNARILNIGMGSGHLSEIEPLFPKYYKEILCVDKFEKMVNYLNANEKDSRIRALQMDIQTTELPVALKGRFDFVCSSNSLMYLSDIRQAFSNVTQLLNKNGELFFIWPKRGDVHDLYKAMSRIERWEPYTSDFRNWENYFDNENPTETLNRELKLVGIEILKSELINLSFEEQDKMKFFDLFNCLDYIAEQIPTNDLPQYKEDYHKLVQARLINEMKSDGRITWRLPVDSLVVAARKI
ncbi:hypothetical protein WA026_023058 [Henosepilachna vigintioctopunctata]|uniref:Methyltransferase type 11 domain-containing protein n=1 Tax=Henosepilachna vigintioctopunctata TaxID=420089 RepID=A0AAW1V3Y4_9CUCU